MKAVCIPGAMWPPPDRGSLTILALILAGSVVAGCSASGSNARKETENSSARDRTPAVVRPPSWEEEIVAGTARAFDKVIYYKPAPSTADTIEQTFVPLIVEEVFPHRRDPRRHIGHVVREKDSRVDIQEYQLKPDASTVYAASWTTTLDGVDYKEVHYEWWYPIKSRYDDSWEGSGAGINITIDGDGFPVAWEAISNATSNRVLFVSKSLEEAATVQFGPPLPGRSYSVERGRDETPEVIVAGLMDDGPVPMGPYVYLGSEADATITTILCRCAPSQFNEVVETVQYELRPLHDLGEFDSPTMHGRTEAEFIHLVKSDLRAYRQPGKSAAPPLDRVLRWPKN